jgi:hypothetical protein
VVGMTRAVATHVMISRNCRLPSALPRLQNLCKRASDRAKASTFSAAPLLLSPHTLPLSVHLPSAQHATLCQSLFCISHSLVADLTRRFFYLTFCSLTSVSLRSPTTCLTAADTVAVAMAAAAVDAAVTGTKITRQEADRTTTTTTRANTHRTGRTIHPRCMGEASVAWFLAIPVLRHLFAYHLLCAQIKSGDRACIACFCRSSERSRTCCDSVEAPCS